MVSGVVSGTGGRDCIMCHDVANIITGYNVSVSSMNQSDNIHARLNSDMSYAANTNTSSANNSICWGCHVNDGSEPPTVYDCSNATIYKCYDCHDGTDPSAPVVKEHFKLGDDIKAITTAANATESCIVCHNQTEMKRTYTESDDNYTNLSLASHYGKKRYNLIIIPSSGSNYTNCMYCHNNSTTAFPVTNNSLTSHTIYATCISLNCHDSGRIHDASLVKYKIGGCEGCHIGMDTTVHKSGVTCLQCHNNKTLDYSETKLSPGLYNAKTTIHTTNITPSNNASTSSPLCTECHTKTAAEIQEGYENASGGYAMVNDSSNLAPYDYGSNMTHNRDTITAREGNDPPDYDSKMYARHANPNSSGGWFGGLTGSARDPNQICINCHSSSVNTEEGCDKCHALWGFEEDEDGNPIMIQLDVHTLSVPDCYVCHNVGDTIGKPHIEGDVGPPKNYAQVLDVSYKPMMLKDSVHKDMIVDDKGCLICHTNVDFTINYAVNPVSITIPTDHSGVHTWNSQPDCTKCHSINASVELQAKPAHDNFSSALEWGNNTQCLDSCHNSTESPFTGLTPPLTRGHGHSVQSAGGPDCIECHDIGKVSPKVNFSVVNNTLSVHKNISTYESIASVTGINDTNKICWACHMNDSTYTDKTNKSHADRLGDFNGVHVYTCVDCHIDKKPLNITNQIPVVFEHFYGGNLTAGNSTDDISSCEVCHNLSKMKLLNSGPEGADDPTNASYLIAHYGKKQGTGVDSIRTWSINDAGAAAANTSVNCSYCHQADSPFNDSSIMVNPIFNSSIKEHSLNASKFGSNSPNCTDSKCHVGGWMHNASLAKPALTTNPADSVVCLSCHGANSSGGANWTELETGVKARHNGTLDCTECHLNESRDIHGVKYLQKDDTYSTSNSSVVDCIRCHNDEADLDNISMFRPLVPTNNNLNFNHSEDPENGSRWNETSYWDSVEGACYYCHGDTKHNDSALGPIEHIQGSNIRNGTIDASSYWCSGCHYQAADNYHVIGNWTMIPPTIYYDNTGLVNATDDVNVRWYNHTLSDFSDRSCSACHGGLLSDNPTTAEFAHNAAEGEFGPDCISCHDISKGSPKINFSVVNDSLSIHQNISNYSSIPDVDGVNDTNKICWACHMNNSKYTDTVNQSVHGDRLGDYNGVPVYTCDECHVDNIAATAHIMPVSVLVKEHFYGGANLTAGNSTDNLTSCEVCHNLGEMKLGVTLDKTPGGTDLEDQSDASYLIAHYGKKRNLRTWDGGVNCSYCHQADSGFNDTSIMVNPILNSSIQNHSLRYPSSPANNCTNASCHVGGRMHEASLAKPDLMINGTEDSDICLSCHDSTNYSTYMSHTLPKSRHNDTLNCSECHLSEARDIHGVKYLQKNGIYNTSNSSAVDCYTCHSSGAVDNNINATIPKVPDNNYGFSHSDAPTSGSRWNNSSYWDDSNGACLFCHNDTKHETIAIGPIINIDVNDSHATITSGSTSELCSGCHVEGKESYNATLRPQAPPTICVNNTGNSTAWDSTGQGWYDHSDISSFYDAGCKGCHGSLLSTTPTTTEFVHNVGEGGGKYCVECHDIINTNMNETFQIDVQAMNKSDAIHYDLNRVAIAEMNKSHSPDNVRCWACHGEGDGSDAAQPEGHPDRVNNENPRNCSDMDCHNVNQSLFNEPMVYEHFMHVDIIDENISTKADCPACHINSVMPNYDPNPDNSTNTSMASHYGSTHDLANTTSCVYCHLDEDNAEEWGNAPDPTTNISRLSDEELEETLFIGDKWHLGNRYFMVFEDISVDGDSAFLKLYHNDTLLEEIVVSDVYNFTYEDDFIDPDGDKESDVVVLELNFTAVFRGEQTALVMVEGSSWKRIHPEDKDPACWACHMDNHTIDKKEYLVLDEDEDNIYYLEKLLDFSDEDTEEDKVTLLPRKLVLREGYNQTLDVDGDHYILNASEVDINGNKAYITLVKDGSVIEDSVYMEGEIIEFEYDLSYDNHKINDFVIFTAKVDSVFHGYNTDLVSLTDVKVFSDRLMAAEIDDDEKVGGYNTTHLHVNHTFSIGGYPDTFHVPPLNEGLDGGSDCVRCHDVSHRFGISSVDAIQSRLGGHSQLNANATSKDNTTDDINKACWACHGTGVDPERHPADYLYPRQCQDCHTDMEAPTYGAVDLSDEAHGQFEDCNRCHAADYPGLHVINIFEPDIPYIVSINMSSEVVTSGETVTVKAAAMSSWNMKVKAIEYFIDVEGLPGTGTQLMPLDGIFDEQVEEVEFTIDTTELMPGVHIIYLRAMERDNEWGPVNEAEFSIDIPVPGAEPESKRSPLLIPAIIIGIAGILLLLLRKSGYLFNLNEIPGNDSEKLLEHLEQNYGIDWAKTADIEKINNGNVVKVSTDVNNLTMELNDEKTRLYLNINGGKTDEFIVKMKDGELKTFKKGIRYRKGII